MEGTAGKDASLFVLLTPLSPPSGARWRHAIHFLPSFSSCCSLFPSDRRRCLLLLLPHRRFACFRRLSPPTHTHMTPAASHATLPTAPSPPVARGKQPADRENGAPTVWSRMLTPGCHWEDKVSRRMRAVHPMTDRVFGLSGGVSGRDLLDSSGGSHRNWHLVGLLGLVLLILPNSYADTFPNTGTGLSGFFGIASFVATNAFLVFVYSTYFNDETEEEMMEFVKEGFMTAFAAFMVSWIMTYSAVFHPHIFSNSILFPSASVPSS